jgi:hypothetical protein
MAQRNRFGKNPCFFHGEDSGMVTDFVFLKHRRKSRGKACSSK